MEDIIFNEEVPVTTCLFVSHGLPSSGKTTVFEKIIKELINLPPDPKLTFDEYIKRKKNDKCLSLYELGALGTTTSDQTVWSFATNRYGAVFAILCALAQRRNGFNLINEQPVADPEEDSFLVQHVQWLKRQAATIYEHVKNDPDTIALIQDGITLTNVMDVGVNIALYEILQMMVLYCHRHIRFAFFSLDRDPPNFDEKPDLAPERYGDESRTLLQLESRLAYLLKFATLGYDTNPDDNNAKTVVVATSEVATSNEMPDDTKKLIKNTAQKLNMDKFLTDWIFINTDDRASIKNMADKFQNLVTRSKCHQVKLPLRWIVFRSLLTSLKSGDSGDSKVFVLSKDFIIEQAKSFNMDTDDVENFLHSFTDFGSILYVPRCEPLKNIVIVDIWRFTECLHKLFYPNKEAAHAENLQKYGIISFESIKKILDHEATEDFLHITTTLAMIAEISCPIDQKCLTLQKDEKYYYIPAARVKEQYTPSRSFKEYVLLKQEEVSFPCSIQAGICHEIMKNEKFVLVATECSNVSRFKFDSSEIKQDFFEIEMVYHASQIRIQMSNNCDYDDDATVRACRAILTASNNCLQKIIKMKYVKYVVAIPCCASSSQKFHDFSSDSESTLCKECSVESPHNCFRSCWSKAANLGDKKSYS